MKVALDISSTQSGHKNRGIGFYTQRLHKHLARLITHEKDFTLVPYSGKIPVADLIHIPAFSPFSLSLSLQNLTHTVVTVHDLIPLEYPQHFPPGIRGALVWQIQKNLLRLVRHIITDSNASCKAITDITGIPNDRISVVYLAADERFKPEVRKAELSRVKDAFKLPEKFILYVGDMNWNKNVVSLAKICVGMGLHLVVVGKQAIAEIDPMHPWNTELAAFQIEAKQHADYIHCLGFVKLDDLNTLYSLASLLVHPAKAEGFGLSILEAMQCGCPVITSNRSSLAEIAGDAAILFDPENDRDLEGAIQSVWKNDRLRKELREKGLVHSKQFTWDKTAKETLEIYRKSMR